MKKNMMRRNLHQSIRRSLARYIAIVAIIALGAGIFVGLRTTKSDMIATGQRFMDEQNMFDLRLLSTYGWDKEDVSQIAALDGVEDAEGVISLDVIASFEGTETESVYKVYSIPETVNRVYLHGGRMPQAPDECLADAYMYTEDILGTTITVSGNNPQDTLDSLSCRTFTVVGLVSSPLYIDLSRGNTTLGNGTITSFLYLPEESFDLDYYPEIAVTLNAGQDIYTDEYHDFVQDEADRLENSFHAVADERYQSILGEAEDAYSDGLSEYEQGLADFNAEKAQAEAELAAAKQSLDDSQDQLEQLSALLPAGHPQLIQLETAVSQGWGDYDSARQEADTEFAEAEAELADAKAELDKARADIDAMAALDVYALGRTTNMGYLALDNNSDIVQGVSTVFPAFFLLIAALVCITTMTRMVEEERTQIGTLKALGYSNGAIIGKYLSYAGSAAVIGCGLGVVVGSVVFPLVLWEAYKILILMGDYFVLQMDWGLCLLVVFAYTAVTLFVTWYACRLSLREVPAELIRPKPPTSGKKIFLERLPFWNRISFLNKVMLRNIFRYRQRLLMMLVGIGGCTALLLTGFGISDSIGDIAAHHFSEVVLYDMEVRFSEGQSTDQQQSFVQGLEAQTDSVFFYHQSSVELVLDDQSQDITFLVADSEIQDHIDFHNGDTQLPMPADGECLMSIGVAEQLGISVGDTVQIRDADMRTLKLQVSGIYENHVHNYVIVTPHTVQLQWDTIPQMQMACVEVSESADVHEVGADISEMEGVMSVTVNQDVQEQVEKMLEALDLVVVTVVICAALLAIIVLYNLTNINITERIREIATIKVLGFNSRESAAYVFKENLLLSVMGAALGLVGGIFLLEFVMSQIKVDMVWMTARLLPMSYVWSVIITMLSACLVDFILFFRLEKINMAEALKSVE